MTDTSTLEQLATGCPSCGAALAADQRYCLECGESGRRQGPPHVLVPVPAPARARGVWTTGPTGAIAAVACLLLAMGVGVLIGRSNGANVNRVVAAQPPPPQVITVNAGGASPVAAAGFTDDWPAGMIGYTVKLAKLSSAAAVPAAKAAASAKGARGVGALSGDNYQGLGAGSFIVYSGVYPKKAQAVKALARLKAHFPAASVVAVKPVAGGSAAAAATRPAASAGPASPALQKLQNATGQDYVKKSKALPNKISTGGAPPPVDTGKPAGGGTGFSTIG